MTYSQIVTRDHIAGRRFADVVTDIIIKLVQEFGYTGDIEVTAPAELTGGITGITTPMGHVRVVSVIGATRFGVAFK